MKIEKDKFNALSEKDQNLQLLKVSIFQRTIKLDPKSLVNKSKTLLFDSNIGNILVSIIFGLIAPPGEELSRRKTVNWQSVVFKVSM